MRFAAFAIGAGIALLAGSAVAATGLTPELSALVESERSFSRTAGTKGVKESFLEYFAPDSISFQPDPGPAIARVRDWPPPKRPGVVLSWEPVFADISHAGDMGYTTGPTLTHDTGPEPRPDRHGWYFSVWRKQTSGDWKVALDVGVATPGDPSPKPQLHAASAPGYASGKAGEVDAQRTAILALEREPGADARHAAQESRLHRDGVFPILGHAAVVADLAQRPGPTLAEPKDVVVSSSADLAYGYGSFTRGASAGGATEHGWYTRVWKRNPAGGWEMVAQIEQLAQE
jgi:ketosteroid isomerase-like protein